MYDNHYSEHPLNKPLYGATMQQSVKRFFKKYANFSGYASRSEYWWVALFLFLVLLLPNFFSTLGRDSDSALLSTLGFFASAIYLLILMITLIPNLAITWRRLHDAGFSGAYFFMSFIPFVGWIVLLVMLIMPTNTLKHRPEWDDIK